MYILFLGVYWAVDAMGVPQDHVILFAATVHAQQHHPPGPCDAPATGKTEIQDPNQHSYDA